MCSFTSWLTTGSSLSLSSSFFCRNWSWDLASASSCWNCDTSWECFSFSTLHSGINRHSSYSICPLKQVLHWVSYATTNDMTGHGTWLAAALTESFANTFTATVKSQRFYTRQMHECILTYWKKHPKQNSLVVVQLQTTD